MKSLRLRNVRSIEDTGEIELLPLTIVVGRNSVGKSSIVRWLPLLAQSQSADTTAPIAWHRRSQGLVNFGSFDETLRRGAPNPGRIIFKWTFEFDGALAETLPDAEARTVSVVTSLRSASAGGATYVERWDIQVGAVQYVFISSGPDQTVDLYISPQPIGQESLDIAINGLLPAMEPTDVTAELAARLDAIKFRRVEASRLTSIASSLTGWTAEELHRQVRTHPKLTPAWRDNFGHVGDQPNTWANILRLVALRQAPQLLAAARKHLRTTLDNLVYVAPFRYEPLRSERSPEASSRLDSRGEGLLSFLEGLRESERAELSAWIQDAIGFSIGLRKEGLTTELRITDANGFEANIADVGYGVGQVLPVLLHLWAVSRDPARAAGIRPVVIEQPELHLHPAMQARVGRLLARVAHESGPLGARLLVETHSEALVNAVGEAIAKGSLRASDVQVLMVEQLPGAPSTVRAVRFDDAGYLDPAVWPYGFFSA